MIIDCHCHAGKGDGLTAPWNTDAPLAAYLRRARAAGIQRTVVFAPFHSDYDRANAQVARIIQRHPGRLLGFAFVHPRLDSGRVEAMVSKAVQEWGFCGIKVHGRDAMPTREVCETARKLGLPLLVDVIGQTSVVEMLATQYPDLNLIIPHLGSFRDDWRAHQQTIDQMVRLPNVYGDSSGVRRFDYLVQAVRRAGPHKLLFGSDGPWLHPGVEIHKMRLLGLPPDELALVLGGNLLRLIRPALARQAGRRAATALRRRMPAQPAATGTAGPYMAAPDLAAQATAAPFRMAAKVQPDSTYTGEEYEL